MKSGFIAKLHQYSQPGLQAKPQTHQQTTLKKSNVAQHDPAHYPAGSNIKVQDLTDNVASRDRLSLLMKQNIELEAKEQRYLQKLNRLEEGMEKQYHESVKLQELYSNLLDSYKAKEEQIRQLQMRYRVYEESEKRRLDSGQSMEVVRKDNELLQELLDEHKARIVSLQKQLDEANASLSLLKASQLKTEDLKVAGLSGRYIEKITSLQHDYDALKETQMVLQCENDYLKNRNQDLEEYRHQLDRMTVGKQTEIARLRDEKLNLLRNETERRLALSSRGHSPRDSSPSKTSERIRALQHENRQLKSELEDAHSQIAELGSIVALQRERIYTAEEPSPVNIRHDDFFSFSKEELQGRSRPADIRQDRSHSDWLKQQEQPSKRSDRVEQADTAAAPSSNQNRRAREQDNLLPPFPKELEIDSLIRTLEKANEANEQRWSLAES